MYDPATEKWIREKAAAGDYRALGKLTDRTESIWATNSPSGTDQSRGQKEAWREMVKAKKEGRPFNEAEWEKRNPYVSQSTAGRRKNAVSAMRLLSGRKYGREHEMTAAQRAAARKNYERIQARRKKG